MRDSNENYKMAFQFYAPIYMLLTVCDREPVRGPRGIPHSLSEALRV